MDHDFIFHRFPPTADYYTPPRGEKVWPRALLALHGIDSVLARTLGSDMKGKLSLVLYALAIFIAFVNSWVAGGVYVLVAILWLIPDRRTEKVLAERRT